MAFENGHHSVKFFYRYTKTHLKFKGDRHGKAFVKTARTTKFTTQFIKNTAQALPINQRDTAPAPVEWPTTRQLAESNDITIYQARNLLLNLAGKGKILVTQGPLNNSLRWYPSIKHP